MPSRIVVVFGRLGKSQPVVMVGPHPFGGIDHAALQVGEDLPARRQGNGPAGFGKYFSAQARNPHLKSFEIGHRIEFFVEPAPHLNAGIADGAWDQVKGCIGLLPQFDPAAAVKPGIHPLGVQTEGYGGKPLRGTHLTRPVVSRTAAHFNRAVRNGLKGFHGRHQLAGGINLNADLAFRSQVDPLGKCIQPDLKHRKIGRPGGDHFQIVLLFSDSSRCIHSSRRNRSSSDTRLFQKFTSLHHQTPLLKLTGD